MAASASIARRIQLLSIRKQFKGLTDAEETEFQRLRTQLRQARLQESKNRG